MSDHIRVDEHKLSLHPSRVADWLKAEDGWEGLRKLYPVYVEISPFGGCNFRCSFCAVDFLGYEQNRIELPVLKECLSTLKAKGVKSVLFAGEGEPMLYPGIEEALQHCFEIGLDAALNTNGSVSNHKALKSAIRNCKWIRTSLNAGTREVHASVHRCSPRIFDQIFENLEYCVSERRNQGSLCTLGAQAILLRENADTLEDLVRRCRDIGLDYVVIKPYSQHPESITRENEGADYSGIYEIAERLSQYQSASFKVYSRLGSFERAKIDSPRYERCYSVPMFWAYIRATGDVYGCSNFMTDQRFLYGNIKTSRFDEIWEGPKRKTALSYMLHDHDISRCRVNCRMDKVNEYLWELRNPSFHANYI